MPSPGPADRARSLTLGVAIAVAVCLAATVLVDRYAPCGGQCRSPYVYAVTFPPGTSQTEITRVLDGCARAPGVVGVHPAVDQTFGPHLDLLRMDARGLDRCLRPSGARGAFPD